MDKLLRELRSLYHSIFERLSSVFRVPSLSHAPQGAVVIAFTHFVALPVRCCLCTSNNIALRLSKYLLRQRTTFRALRVGRTTRQAPCS